MAPSSSFLYQKVLKLGTRRSLLARAQSQWVANEIEKKNPGIQIQLVGIDTKGDQIQNVSLQRIEGKDFFVAELDEALKRRDVDFTVHSMKDLSLERPFELISAAIPPRENPRDIILFNGDVIDSLQKGKILKIGTSSPRRIENIPPFLVRALPLFSQTPAFKMVEIRGNVNTRLSRIHEPQDSDKYLDGVVLAFAGLIRLWKDEEGQQVLQRLLENIRIMVLPLDENPTAPAQGALAIECRKEDSEVFQILQKIHDPMTESQVEEERAILKKWGGGCHQRFGATVTQGLELGNLLWIKGVKMTGEPVDELRWQSPPQPLLSSSSSSSPSPTLTVWNGHEERGEGEKERADLPFSHIQSEAIFIAHSRALPIGEGGKVNPSYWNQKRIWTSGVPSWFRLAEKGIWVEGCAEGLGFENWKQILLKSSGFEEESKKGLLHLPPLKEWTVLTHQGALSEWAHLEMKVIPTYEIQGRDYEESRQRLKKAQFIYWSSGSQVQLFQKDIPLGAIHACGPGKTFHELCKLNLNPLAFPSVKHWKKWIQNE